MMLNIL